MEVCFCRFAENPLVLNAPFIRFYAGAPLVTSTGQRVGTVCIVDDRPRELEAQSLNVLVNFSEVVVRELEKESARVSSPLLGLLVKAVSMLRP